MNGLRKGEKDLIPRPPQPRLLKFNEPHDEVSYPPTGALWVEVEECFVSAEEIVAKPETVAVSLTLDEFWKSFEGKEPERDEVLRSAIKHDLIPGTTEVPMEPFRERLRKTVKPGTKGLGRRMVEIRLKKLKEELNGSSS